MRLLAAFAVACVLAASASAATGDPKHRHTPDGMKLAQRALLARGDLGKGWTAKATPSKPSSFACNSFHPDQSDLVEIGAAASPNFRGTATGPFVSQVAYVFATEQQARAVWSRIVGPGLLRCLAESITNGSTQAVTFVVKRTQTRTVPKLADRSAAFRVVATADSPGQKLTTTYDMIVLGSGRVVTGISFAAFSEAVPTDVELALARTVAKRIGASPSA